MYQGTSIPPSPPGFCVMGVEMGEGEPKSSKIDLGSSIDVETFFANRKNLIAKEKTHRSGMS